MLFTVPGAPLSPFVRKVHIAMRLKIKDFTLEPVSVVTPPEGSGKINPASISPFSNTIAPGIASAREIVIKMLAVASGASWAQAACAGHIC